MPIQVLCPVFNWIICFLLLSSWVLYTFWILTPYGDPSSIPGSARSTGEGKGCPLQYSGLENSMLYSPWGRKELDMTEWLSLPSLTIRYMVCKYFFLHRLSFHFVDCFFCCAETFKFDTMPHVYPWFCCLYFRCHSWKVIAKIHVRKLLFSSRGERLHFHFSLLYFGEGNGNPLQCSCLENPRDGVAQSWPWLKWLSSSRGFMVSGLLFRLSIHF